MGAAILFSTSFDRFMGQKMLKKVLIHFFNQFFRKNWSEVGGLAGTCTCSSSFLYTSWYFLYCPSFLFFSDNITYLYVHF